MASKPELGQSGRLVHNRLVRSITHDALASAASRFATGRLIDIGCGDKPYETLFRPFVREHIGLDHEATLHDRSRIDVFGTAYEMPVPSETFDTAICTAVLEHLEEPEEALRECFRVLRPGGIAIYVVPHIWHLHEEPRDFYRFTRHGLTYLFDKCGFEIVELEALSGFWVTWGTMLSYYVNRLNRPPIRATRIVDAMTWSIQAVAAALERADRPERWSWAYIVVARRPPA